MANKNEPSGFELLKQGYEEDLAKLRQKIEKEEREKSNDLVNGRGSMNRYISDWKLNKFPYTASEKEKAKKVHLSSQQIRDAELERKIKDRFEAEKLKLQENIFGKGGLEEAQARHEKEERIQAFKAKQRAREKSERDRNEALNRKIEEWRKSKKIIKDQSQNLVSDQNNTPQNEQSKEQSKIESIKGEFNVEAEKIKTLSGAFNEQNSEQKSSTIGAKIKEFKEKQREQKKTDYIRDQGGYDRLD